LVILRALAQLQLHPVEPLKPPLKWAGGKRWLVPYLREYWSPFSDRRLVEPFCGGLAVALGLLPDKAILNDLNPHLIHFYQCLKRGIQISAPLENKEEAFYAGRKRFNELLRINHGHSAEAAGLFYYLNRTGFNGLCRFNKKGEFNVPFGEYNRINYTRDFTAYAQVFKRWEFTNMDFEKLPLKPTDFVYADPPYDVQFRQYSKEGFGFEEQERTAKWLAKHEGPVVLSNQSTPRIRELYEGLGYKLKILHAPRRISCTGDRTPAEEVLATRNID
jgi:DNA adenine methylase